MTDPRVEHETYTIARNVGDRTFLYWLHARLLNVYKENPDIDFVRTLGDFADKFRPTDAFKGDVRGALFDNDLHYLRSILQHLREMRTALADEAAFSLGGEALADNIDWLDCLIDKHERAPSPAQDEGEGWSLQRDRRSEGCVT